MLSSAMLSTGTVLLMSKGKRACFPDPGLASDVIMICELGIMGGKRTTRIILKQRPFSLSPT